MTAARNILVIAAHPDDIDFGCAGSVATWTAAGARVTYCLVTSGDAGGSDRSSTLEQRRTLREAEQTAAAKQVGVSELIFLRHPDGRVAPTFDLRRDLSRVIRTVRPDRVVTQSAERNLRRIYASHPDHLATGSAAIDAVYPDARNPFAHPELLEAGLEPWLVPEVWIMGPQASMGDVTYVDITDTFDAKMAALRSHVSQVTNAPDVDERLRGWGVELAALANLPDGHLAEAFTVVDTR